MRTNILPIRSIVGLAALLAAFAVGCSGRSGMVDTTGDLVMNFSGFTPHIGETLYLKVTDRTNGTSVVTGTMAPRVITADTFLVELPNVIDQGRAYHIDFGVDVDGNGILDASPMGTPTGVDHTWRIRDSANGADLLRDFVHDTNWEDITPF
jgi:hypothetical protein